MVGDLCNFVKKMGCKNCRLLMTGDYEKKSPQKVGWGVLGITLSQNSTREKKIPPVKILSIPPVK